MIERAGKIMERIFRFLPAHLKLQNAEYSFLYYCRSTPPKSDSTFNREDTEHIMKMKFAQYFMNKGYYFQKVPLKEDTELIISNRRYDATAQFQWTKFKQNIINL